MRAIGRFVALVLTFFLAGCTTTPQPQPNTAQVLFVCEHGNVKSLMATSYFNELAQARALPFRAVSRGAAPDSDTVPDFAKSQLSAEGFDVSAFRPEAVSARDISTSQVVITIGTELPGNMAVDTSKVEQWNDIPPASSEFERSRAALKSRIVTLLDRLAGEKKP